MWKIGNVEIKNRIVFAPMAGISNESFRSIIKSMGAGLIYSEMVSNMGIIYNSKNTINMLKMLHRRTTVWQIAAKHLLQGELYVL